MRVTSLVDLSLHFVLYLQRAGFTRTACLLSDWKYLYIAKMPPKKRKRSCLQKS